MNSVDPRALGQILLIESLVAQLPNKASMLQFTVRGLESIPGIGRVWFQDGPAPPDQAEGHAIEIRHSGHCHAVLRLVVADQALFYPYLPYLQNLAFMLGVVLEERIQREENGRYRTHLESLVALRTRALADSENRARSMLRTALDGVWLVDCNGCLLEVNQAACTMLGYNHDEMLGLRIDRIEVPQSPAQPDLSWLRLHGSHLFESRHRRKDGTEFPVEVSGTFLPETNQAVVFVRDVTERKRSEEALRKAFEERCQLEKQMARSLQMASLGQLAGGVAHDLNNVLGAILVLATSNLEDFPADSPAHRDIDTIAKAAIRGGQMVKGLLNLVRPAPAGDVALDLNSVLQDIVHLLERTTLARVRLTMDLEPGLRTIRGDAAALAHSFLNLCVNSVDAMPGGGTLTLRTRNHEDGMVEVEVRDTGAGMPPEVLRRALDPFFTTKDAGKGTGLGLFMVYGVVEAHHGRMDIQSEPGKGTRVTLSFPACDLKQPASNAAPRSEPSVSGLKVLLVDDDPLFQDSVRALLGKLGHSAVTAASGEEALSKLAEGYRPELVVLDLNMPGLGGAGTLPRLRAVLPEAAIILATGKPDQAAYDLVSSYPKVTLLTKPFTKADLSARLAQFTGSPPDAD